MNKQIQQNLKNKVVIVTGAAGLIGKAFCLEIAKVGGYVILTDINEEKGRDIEDKINEKYDNERANFYRVDITDIKSIRELIRIILDKFEKIDALVNNAYPRNKNYGRKFEDVTYKDFCENINMHLGGYFLITQQIAEAMMKQNFGNIINIASIYGFTAPRFEIYEGTDMTMPVEYAAIKGGIINLTKYLASYLGKYNIRVNCISPGGIFDNQPKSFVERYSRKVLLGKRMANVDDLIGALLFLLTDASKYMTGQNIIVDGGWSL